MPESLTLSELQTAKDTVETKAHRLREALQELRRTRPDGWQETFSQVQSELIEVVTGISQLERRIRALVEGEDPHELLAERTRRSGWS
jgi:uncharacterized coiled-coil DUF342 family protein